MSHSQLRWTAEDSALYEERRQDANTRLQGWAHWAGHQSPEMIGFSSSSSFVKAMTPQDEELQAGARHMAVECTDEEALEVDAILCRWKKTDPGFWKLAFKEYTVWLPQHVKAKQLGLNRTAYQEQLKVMLNAMWRELHSKRS